MENKKTTELLDLVWDLENQENGKQDWEKYDDVYEELCRRTPFKQILGTNNDDRDLTFTERLDELEKNTTLLKRHKHDDKTGDVMVRI
jgi:hypothetical protein